MLTFIDGAYNRASGTKAAFDGLSADLVAEGYPAMVSRSGDREPEAQLALWYQRMVLKGDVNGRRVYGTKQWQGKTWYQIHPDTVGVPSTSNHEKRRSNDLTAPYNSDTPAHRRAKQLAPRHDITCEGENFREKWHFTYWGAVGTILPADAPASEPSILQGDPMSLRIIDSPFYRAAGYRVIHNGSAATSVQAGLVQDLILKGHVDYCAYDADNLLEFEVQMVWTLGGLSTADAAKKTADMIKALQV